MILDTNALSAWADGNPACRSAFVEATRLIVPVVVLGEYQYGISQSCHRARYEEWLSRSLSFVELQPITSVTASHYADLRLLLKVHGRPIPANDLWIAAQVRELKLPLLSNDAHFDLIPDFDRIAF